MASVLVTTVTLKYQSNTPSGSDRVTVTAGTAARFICTASFSRPQAKIDWYIDDDDTPKQSSTSPTFDLTATEADHNKRIYCKAYNDIQTESQGVLSERPVLYVQGKKNGKQYLIIYLQFLLYNIWTDLKVNPDLTAAEFTV